MWPFTKRRERGEAARTEYVDPADLGIEGRRGIVIVVLSAGWSPQLGDWARAIDGGRLPNGSLVPAAQVHLTPERAARYGLSTDSPHVLAVEAEPGCVHARYRGGWEQRAWNHLTELAASAQPE